MYQSFIIPYLYEAQHVSDDTAHHQEPKTTLASSGFSYVEGCWTCGCWTVSGTLCHVWKARGCQWSFRFLMMGGVSPETCWASYKYGIIKFWYTVASRWIFLYELYYDARIHEHQVRLTTVPYPLPKRVLHTVRSSASSCSLHYTLGFERLWRAVVRSAGLDGVCAANLCCTVTSW